MNTCLFNDGSILVQIGLVPFKYVTIYISFVKDTY